MLSLFCPNPNSHDIAEILLKKLVLDNQSINQLLLHLLLKISNAGSSCQEGEGGGGNSIDQFNTVTFCASLKPRSGFPVSYVMIFFSVQ
jgi:hypothetical protein